MSDETYLAPQEAWSCAEQLRWPMQPALACTSWDTTYRQSPCSASEGYPQGKRGGPQGLYRRTTVPKIPTE